MTVTVPLYLWLLAVTVTPAVISLSVSLLAGKVRRRGKSPAPRPRHLPATDAQMTVWMLGYRWAKAHPDQQDPVTLFALVESYELTNAERRALEQMEPELFAGWLTMGWFDARAGDRPG